MTIARPPTYKAGGSRHRPDPEPGLFARLGSTVTAHPVKVAFAWLLVVAASIGISAALGQPTPSQSAASQLPAGYESARAQAVIDKAFGAPSNNATAFLVVSRSDGQQLSAGDLTLADRLAGGLTRLEANRPETKQHGPAATVRVSQTAQPSPNHLIALAHVSFGGLSGAPATDQAVANLRSDVSRKLARTDLRAQLTGQAASDADNSLTEQLATTGMLLGILILLFVLFRSPGVPFIVVGTIFGVGVGVTSLLNIAAHVGGFQLDQTTTSLLPVVLLGVGTDYTVFLLYRYRDRLRAGDDHRTAMAAAVAKVGHAIVASALAVAVSFSAMFASGLLSFRILGPSLAVAVLAMLATSVTLLPAVLAIGSGRRARSARWTRPAKRATTNRVASLVARRPLPVALGAVAVLVALAAAALGYHASYNQQPYPSGSQSAAGYQQLQRGYPAGALDPTQVVVTARHGAPTTAQLAGFTAQLGRVPGVGRVTRGATAERRPRHRARPATVGQPLQQCRVPNSAGGRGRRGNPRADWHDGARRRGQRGVPRREQGARARHEGDLPAGRSGDLADPSAHAALTPRTGLPVGLGRAWLRRHARRFGAAVPGHPGPPRDRLPAADDRVPVRGQHRH